MFSKLIPKCLQVFGRDILDIFRSNLLRLWEFEALVDDRKPNGATIVRNAANRLEHQCATGLSDKLMYTIENC